MEKITEQRQTTASVCVLECPQQTEYPNQDKNAKVLWKCHQIELVQKLHILHCEHFFCSPVLWYQKTQNFLVCKSAPILSNSISEANEHNLLLFLIRGQRKGDI